MTHTNNKKSKFKEEIIDIKGMHCRSCINSIESKIKSLDGIEKIKVSLIENKAFVKFNPKKLSLSKIKTEIAKLGYSTDKGKTAKKRSIMQGLAYGLIPHIGCIAFIIGSIFGVTLLMQFFKPLLMNRYFFHILVLISLMFATISSIIYLRKNGFLSLAGIKRKWAYLTTMYGTTVGINLILFLLIFPILANVSAGSSPDGEIIVVPDDASSLKIKVDIPCPGHAPLISEELKTIDGVYTIEYSMPNNFLVTYDSEQTSKQEMLSLEVFEAYKPTVLEESSIQKEEVQQQISQPIRGSCGCGGSTCGGSSGSCCGG